MDYFNRPHGFSFKDALAVVFCGFFLYYAWRALDNPQALEVVKQMVYLVSIILLGYFGQEAVESWKKWQNGKAPDQQQAYYYQPPLTTYQHPQTAPVQPVQARPPI